MIRFFEQNKMILKLAALLVLLLIGSVLYLSSESNSRPNPIASDQPMPMTAVQRGRLVYEKYGCAMCHGKDGKKGINNPNSQTGQIPAVIYVKEGYTNAELKARILKGSRIPSADPKKPPPPYKMPGWGDRMTPQELDDLCEYLFSLMPEETKW